MAMLAETDLVGSVTEVAVTVTVPPGGIAAGAVNAAGASLVVVPGLKEPQAVALQDTDHWIWGFAETSLAIAASRDAAVLTWMEAGGGTKKETEMGMGATMV